MPGAMLSWRRLSMLAIVALGIPATGFADIQVVPRISSGLTWSDNFNLAADGDPRQQNLVLEVVPVLELRQEASRVRSRAAVEVRHFEFLQDKIPGRTLKQYSAGAELLALRDWVTLGLDGSHGPTLRDPSGSGVYNNWMFGGENITSQTSYRAIPALDHEFRWGRIHARHLQAGTYYKDSTLPDSRDIGDDLGIGFGDEEGRFSADFSYAHERTRYTGVAQDYQYDRAVGELGLRLGRSLRLLGSGGKESDVARDTSAGGLDTGFWAGGFEYRPNRENVFRAMVGHRFFGDTLDVYWARSARFLEAAIRYGETPTTQSRGDLLDREVVGPVITDPLPGSDGQTPYLRPGADVFIRKVGTASISVIGRLTRLQFLGLREKRDYINTLGRDRIDEYTVGLDRRLGPEWRLRAAATAGRSKLREGANYSESRYEFGATRAIGRTMTVDMSWAYVDRSGAAEPYRVNWGRLTFTKQFGERR